MNHFPTKIALDGATAQTIITDRDIVLAGIFVSPNIERPNWISVLKCACMSRPATPLHMIFQDQTESQKLAEFDLRRLGVKTNVFKPTDYKKMLELVAPIALSFDSEAALLKAKMNPDRDGVASINAEEYSPIRAEDFLSGSNSFFDVYARMGGKEGRFLKLLHAGDSFCADRLESYLKKGVTYFYIKKEVQENYVAYCDHIATALLKSQAPVELKTAQTLNMGEEVSKFYASNGVSDENIKYAQKFISNVNILSKQIANPKTDFLETFLSSVTSYEHGVGTAMLAGMLANALQIESEKATQIVGMSALFHDIALSNIHDWMNLDESEMTDEQKELYFRHPQKAVDELSKLRTFGPGALQAIEQHHMRLFGHGFPKRSGTTIVSKVAEIIGICDELNTLLLKSQNNPHLNLAVALEDKVYPFFPKQLVNVFKKTFYPNQIV